ncbi:MAG: SGNH/GDSL hydrolase family protein [Alphaproteobacteria bacterium]|nr:SGNH/GDSL hydrolase family protein [Alphaproteobacteria bacterium]
MLKNIGVIGDSIAHGYCDKKHSGWFTELSKSILTQKSEQYLFSNMAYTGDNIADAANRACFETLSRRFDLIIVSIGINDLRRRKNSNLQLDFSEGARIMYWHKLLDTLDKTNAEIVVTDLIPIIESRYTSDATLVRYNSDIERYNDIIKTICQQRNIHFFTRYDKWKHRNLEELYHDAIHPNSAGHLIIAQEIFDFLLKNNLL